MEDEAVRVRGSKERMGAVEVVRMAAWEAKSR